MIQADARQIPLKDACVQCVVTSPPYWGLRDYGTARWEGGDPACDHIPPKDVHLAAVAASRLGGGKATQANAEASRSSFRASCGKCGAQRIDSQIGLEASPDAYVAALVQVFREVWRVLKADGVLWLNLGDSYATGAGKVGNCPGGGVQGEGWAKRGAMTSPNRMPIDGLKPKDLCGIPWRVAFALQADGWYLRSDIIWSKPNPMPESVTDRPTKAHEYVFLLTKAERYFWDAEAVREPLVPGKSPRPRRQEGGGSVQSLSGDSTVRHLGLMVSNQNGRNLRSVWSIATQPYTGAHFATMPEKLAERCILAGSKPGDWVLDPFGGSGTVVRVARRFNRRGVLLDLNPAYLSLADGRTSELQVSLFEGVCDANADLSA